MTKFAMATTLCRLEDRVVWLEKTILLATTLAMIVLLLLQIAARAELPLPLDFSDELTRVLLAWMIFIGAGLATHRAQHFAVHILMQYVNFPGKHLVELLVMLITLTFMVTVAWVGIASTSAGAVQSLPSLGISVAFAQAAIPLGFILMIYHTAMLLPRRLAAERHDSQTGESQ